MILAAGWYLKKSALLRALGQLEPERHIKFLSALCYLFKDCMDEYKDWRKCQDHVKAFKACIDKQNKQKKP